jgi:hypothetical protein
MGQRISFAEMKAEQAKMTARWFPVLVRMISEVSRFSSMKLLGFLDTYPLDEAFGRLAELLPWTIGESFGCLWNGSTSRQRRA